MLKRCLLLTGLFVLIVTILLIASVGRTEATKGSAYALVTPGEGSGESVLSHLTPDPKLQGQAPTGRAAIQVHSQLAGSTSPSFTAQDVETWIKSNPALSPRISISPNVPATVSKVEFLSSKEAGQRTESGSFGLDDNNIVGYVTLRGSFYITSPFLDKARVVGGLFLVFDAQTGNLLVVGEVVSKL